ncbi:MAG: cytochrome c biogenesis protein ResB [Bacteroides sp.]|nr:cytochrome c biogenesis protein ResB [Bacteroides sp.]
MWKKPWGWKEGVQICAGLTITGLVLQLCTGGIGWGNLSHPINLYLLAVYLLLIVLSYAVRRHVYFIRWAMSYQAAVPCLAFVVALTLLMGLIRQAPETAAPTDVLGLSKMLSCWPFVLMYIWMTTILGWVSVKHLCSFRWSKTPFLLNHLGLFVALVCATLGSADMQRLTMNVKTGQTEWRATDSKGELHELPIAIELKAFSIDEYPPKLMLIDNATGKALPTEKPEHLLLDEGVKGGTLAGWDVRIVENIEMAASVTTEDTVKFVAWPSTGATYATHLQATSPDGKTTHEGWVSCGSFLFPYQALRLDSICSIVMPDREPKRFASDVEIYTQSGKRQTTTIEVNRPAEIDGWKIYQLSYDETKGRWSDVSVFELVADPWLPWVYAGIGMMLAGAVCMFVTSHKTNKEDKA